MTEYQGLPVAGYTSQSRDNVDRVNRLKEAEERYMRLLDHMMGDPAFDQRWVHIALTHLQQATMAAGRAVFRPTRITLSEDGD